MISPLQCPPRPKCFCIQTLIPMLNYHSVVSQYYLSISNNSILGGIMINQLNNNISVIVINIFIFWQASCQAHHAELAVIETDEENTFIWSVMTKLGGWKLCTIHYTNISISFNYEILFSRQLIVKSMSNRFLFENQIHYVKI